MWRFLFSLTLALGSHNALAAPKPDAGGAVIQLSRIEVVAGLFALDWGGKTEGIVDFARVKDVTPKTAVARAGLRSGDELVAADGRPIGGMTRTEFESWLASSAEPDHPKVFSFVGRRGLRKKAVRFDLTFTRRP